MSRDAAFADSFYFIALLNRKDRHNAEVVRLLQGWNRPLVTTTWVLVEVADALATPSLRGAVHRFLSNAAADPNLQLIPADPIWYDRGLDLFGRRPDKGWSLTDCISFAVMAELGLKDALTGDRHFDQAGFRAILGVPS